MVDLSDTKKRAVKNEKNGYTKEQLLASKRFRGRKDLAKAVLKENRNYTVEEADLLLKKYLKGKVN